MIECERYWTTILQKMHCKTVTNIFNVGNVSVVNIGSICIHGKKLLRNFAFHFALSCEAPAARGEGKKARNFGPPHPSGSGPTLRGPSSMFFLSRLCFSVSNAFVYFVPTAFFLPSFCFVFCPVRIFSVPTP